MKGNRKRAQQTKVADVGLEDFVDRIGIISNEPAEKEEMSSLIVWFAARMRKQVGGIGE